MGFLKSWPPTANELYVRDAPSFRPLMQGDIFEDVPFDKVRSGGSPSTAPNITTERRTVCLIGYPCDIYNEVGSLAKVQSIAIVRDAMGEKVPETLAGCYTLAPYPDLQSDGKMWAADFRAVSNIDRQYLVPANRTATLTEDGWAYFRHRYILAISRLLVKPETCRERGRDMWLEIELWEEWAESQSSSTFQPWFTAASSELGGFSPKDVLAKGDVDDVRQLLRAQLQLL